MVDCRKCEHAVMEGSKKLFCAWFNKYMDVVEVGACNHYKKEEK